MPPPCLKYPVKIGPVKFNLIPSRLRSGIGAQQIQSIPQTKPLLKNVIDSLRKQTVFLKSHQFVIISDPDQAIVKITIMFRLAGMLKVPDMIHFMQHDTEKTAGGKLRAGDQIDFNETERFLLLWSLYEVGGSELPFLLPIQIQQQRYPVKFFLQTELIEHIKDIVKFKISPFTLLAEFI